MNPSYSKQKGNKGERDLAEMLTKISGVKYRRTPSSGGIHEFNCWDLMKIEQKPSIFDGIGIECKNTKTISVPSWIEQCEVSARDSGMEFEPKWFVAFRHKSKWYFILNENYFRKLHGK